MHKQFFFFPLFVHATTVVYFMSGDLNPCRCVSVLIYSVMQAKDVHKLWCGQRMGGLKTYHDAPRACTLEHDRPSRLRICRLCARWLLFFLFLFFFFFFLTFNPVFVWEECFGDVWQSEEGWSFVVSAAGGQRWWRAAAVCLRGNWLSQVNKNTNI